MSFQSTPQVFRFEGNSSTAADVIHGLILFGSMVYFSSNALLLLLIGLLLFRPFRFNGGTHALLVVLFAFGALVNLLVHREEFDATRHASSPAVLLVPMVALLAPALSPRAWGVFVLATCMEVLVGTYEYSIGQVALTQEQSDLANQSLKVEGSSLLYDYRVFGLSSNSSVFAEKIFMSLVILKALPGLLKWRPILYGLLCFGLLLTFNRTAIVGTIFLFLLYLPWTNLSRGRVFAYICGGSVLGFLVVSNFDYLVLQATRNSAGDLTHSELSRLYLWEMASEKVAENPLSGNGSLTFRVNDFLLGSPQHVHNSVLMLLATHGLVISAFLLLYVALGVNRGNFRAIIALFLFSITQYFFFWNLSAPDFLLYWFLSRKAANLDGDPTEAHLQISDIPTTSLGEKRSAPAPAMRGKLASH